MSTKYPGNIVTSGAPAGYSVAFDGTGDYLSLSSGTSLGAGNFTIECWVYLTAAAASETTVGSSTNYYTVGYNGNFVFRVGTTNLWRSFDGQGSQATIDGSFTWATGQWYHMAWVRNSGTVTVYRNGTSLGSVADSKTLSDSTNGYGIAATRQASSYSSLLTGYISNLRIVVGTALYTAAFTPPTQLLAITNTSLLTCNSPAIVDQSSNAFTITANGNAAVSTFTPFQGYVAYNPALGAATPGVWTITDALQAAQTRRWNMYDPYFNYTTLLLHGNGTNGAQNNTFLDSSSNNFTITRNGNTTQGTFSPFSQTGWSNYFDGTGDYLTGTITAVNNTTMTMECWVWLNALDNVDGDHLLQVNNGANSNYFISHNQNGQARFVSRNNSGGSIFDLISANNVLQTNKWHHIVGVRNASAASLYVDGTRVATVSSPSVSSTDGTSLYVASNGGGGREPNGYISNARIVSGTAVYDPTSSSLTVPTSPLTAVSGTRILTCESNRFVDNSGNNVALTVNGTPSVQAFSPFLTNVAYTPQVQGGSGYFDGTGDYLETNYSASLSGNYSIETWFYLNTVSAQSSIFTIGNAAASTGIALYYSSTSNQLVVLTNGSATITTGSALKPFTWYHIALVRSGSSNILYLNGAQVGSTWTSSATFSGTFRIGIEYTTTAGATINGYISSFRVSNTNRTITVPTAPYTNDANTNLLCNFTNAGIIDATAKNVLETVGNAQISTTQSKFGGSSMYFDGTGDWLQQPISESANIANGDFTIEAWIYPTVVSGGTRTIVSTYTNGYIFYINSSAQLQFDKYGVSTPITGSGTISANTWTHVAITRSGNTFRIFINGTQDASATSSTTFSNTSPLRVGDSGNGSQTFTGYIDDLRMTKGYARYTGNFTVQTSQWQDQ